MCIKLHKAIWKQSGGIRGENVMQRRIQINQTNPFQARARRVKRPDLLIKHVCRSGY